MPDIWTPVAETKRTARPPRAVAPGGVISGYASLFGETDLGGDIVAKGAFRDSLRRNGPARVRMLFQHDPTEPIGVWDEIREDSMGLRVRGRLALKVARAAEVWSLIQEGAIDGLSIGFKAVSARRDARSGVRRLERVDLWEISIVTFPMLPEARIAALKAAPPLVPKRAPLGLATSHAGSIRAQAEALFRPR
jgi:HK97 family phage prohead protease